jgi:glutamine amidotransferase-like uncharacterized protein
MYDVPKSTDRTGLCDRRSVRFRWAPSFFLTAHAGLIIWLAVHQSPNIDEAAHLAAGMSMWQYGTHDVYCVNPPLMRMVATIPILFFPHEERWGDFDGAPRPRPEFVLGRQFVNAHVDNWQRFLILGRLTLVPFSVLGGACCFFWARDMFGPRSGLAALCLWCFSPDLISWAAVLGTDAIAASMGLTAAYAYWRWLKEPSWRHASLAGTMLGLALASKLTWIILLFVWPSIWCVVAFNDYRGARVAPRFIQLIVIHLIGVYVINLFYEFDGTFTQLGHYSFYSRLLTGQPPEGLIAGGGNRFSDSFVARVPLPLPYDYVCGLDLQKADFEVGTPSYLFGQWSDHGWWYYYLVGFCLKTPLATLALILLAVSRYCWLCIRYSYRAPPSVDCQRRSSFLNHAVVTMHGLCALILISSQDGFSCHYRYVIPVLPFVFLAISHVANWMRWKSVPLWPLAFGLLTWSVAECLSVFPYTVSYFNEFAGGPAKGHFQMLGSSCGWSHDHWYVKNWLDAHPEIGSPYVSLERSVDLERLGIRSRGLPPQSIARSASCFTNPSLGPVPGWHVICVQHIHDVGGGYAYFLDFEPVKVIGYSTFVYHITRENAVEARLRLGLPGLPPSITECDTLMEDLVNSRDSTRAVNVALFVPKGSDPLVIHLRQAIRESNDITLAVVSENEIIEGSLKGYDVLVVPGGLGEAQGGALGVVGRMEVRRFVESGGGYVGVCAGAYLAATGFDWSLGLANARVQAGGRYVPGEQSVKSSFRGWGSVSIGFTTEGARVLGPISEPVTFDYTGGPIFCNANEPELPDYLPLAYYRSEVWKYPFQRGTMLNTPAAVAARFGRGRIILFGSHPETSSHKELIQRAIHAVMSSGNKK